MTTESDYLKTVNDDPGNPAFVDLAELFRTSERPIDGILTCLRGLSANPSCYRGRLLLARLYYESNFAPFAIRELAILYEELPDNKTIARLLSKLSNGQPDHEPRAGAHGIDQKPNKQEIIAEADFDFSDLDLIEDEDDERSN